MKLILHCRPRQGNRHLVSRVKFGCLAYAMNQPSLNPRGGDPALQSDAARLDCGTEEPSRPSSQTFSSNGMRRMKHSITAPLTPHRRLAAGPSVPRTAVRQPSVSATLAWLGSRAWTSPTWTGGEIQLQKRTKLHQALPSTRTSPGCETTAPSPRRARGSKACLQQRGKNHIV